MVGIFGRGKLFLMMTTFSNLYTRPIYKYGNLKLPNF